jgi:hypothetical protein
LRFKAKVTETLFKSKPGKGLHDYSPRYGGSRSKRITVQGWPEQKLETLSEKDWGCGSNGRMLAQQAQDPEFNYHNIKQKQTNKQTAGACVNLNEPEL